MAHFTSNTYQLKRKILNFTNKISRTLPKPDRKFTADITYGMLASKSCLLTDVADHLHEPSKKVNVVERLSRHLEKGTPSLSVAAYLRQVKKMIPSDPVIHIDDSDVTKPDGYKFEALGIVRDGSESTAAKNVYKKAITLRKLASLLPAITPSAFFQGSIRLLRKITSPPTPSRSRLWNRLWPCLAKQPLLWTGGMMTTKCS